MLVQLSAILFLVITSILYCCIHISTPLDREVDDEEQEKYLKHYCK